MSRRNKIVLVLMLLVGIGIFAYSLRNVKLSSLVHDIQTLRWEWLLVALACIIIYLLIEAVIVQLFMSERDDDFTFKDAIRVPLVEQLFNGLTPFSTGGQPAQLIAMIQSGVEAGQASSVLLMKFVIFQSMIVINFLISLVIGFHFIAEKLQALSLLVVFGFLFHLAVVVGLLMIMYWNGMTKKLVNLLIKPVKWCGSKDKYESIKSNLDEKIDSFYKESLKMKQEGFKLVKVAIMTLIQLLFYYLIPYFIMFALGVSHVNVIMVTSLHVLIVMIISLFPIPGGSGGAEYSFSVLFSSFISVNSKLVLAMLLWRLLTYYFGMFAGMFALAFEPKKRKKKWLGKN